jgi:hypothetical protein
MAVSGTVNNTPIIQNNIQARPGEADSDPIYNPYPKPSDATNNTTRSSSGYYQQNVSDGKPYVTRGQAIEVMKYFNSHPGETKVTLGGTEFELRRNEKGERYLAATAEVQVGNSAVDINITKTSHIPLTEGRLGGLDGQN